jgi:hypothetical protein
MIGLLEKKNKTFHVKGKPIQVFVSKNSINVQVQNLRIPLKEILNKCLKGYIFENKFKIMKVL